MVRPTQVDLADRIEAIIENAVSTIRRYFSITIKSKPTIYKAIATVTDW